MQQKDDIISDLDSQIVKLIQDEDELIGDVCEAEEIKESLLTTIIQITQLLETRSTPVETRPPQPVLVTNSDLPLPSPQDTSVQVEHSSTEH